MSIYAHAKRKKEKNFTEMVSFCIKCDILNGFCMSLECTLIFTRLIIPNLDGCVFRSGGQHLVYGMKSYACNGVTVSHQCKSLWSSGNPIYGTGGFTGWSIIKFLLHLCWLGFQLHNLFNFSKYLLSISTHTHSPFFVIGSQKSTSFLTAQHIFALDQVQNHYFQIQSLKL